MSRLLTARDDEDHGMSDAQIVDQIAVLMLAGGEATSAAVTWAWHLLTARHPEILRAVPGREPTPSSAATLRAGTICLTST